MSYANNYRTSLSSYGKLFSKMRMKYFIPNLLQLFVNVCRLWRDIACSAPVLQAILWDFSNGMNARLSLFFSVSLCWVFALFNFQPAMVQTSKSQPQPRPFSIWRREKVPLYVEKELGWGYLCNKAPSTFNRFSSVLGTRYCFCFSVSLRYAFIYPLNSESQPWATQRLSR